MSIRINKEKCIGCGKCTEVCPGTLLSMTKRKANMDYPRDCWGCVSCVKECPVEAIEFFLGADIGGKGSVMTVKQEENVLHWNIKDPNGMETMIDVDRRNSNNY